MRDWWLRTLLVLQRPRPVFAALRDDTREAAGDRSEQVLLVVLLAGIATVLFTGSAAHLNDDGSYSPILIAIWAFFAGSIYGLFGYFALGAVIGVRAVHGWTWARAASACALALVAPVALALVLSTL
jgi:hypothetical protein